MSDHPTPGHEMQEGITLEICNECGGLIGWEYLRDGCCLGGVVCKREAGTRFVSWDVAQARSQGLEEERDALRKEGVQLAAIVRASPSFVAKPVLERWDALLVSLGLPDEEGEQGGLTREEAEGLWLVLFHGRSAARADSFNLDAYRAGVTKLKALAGRGES